MTADIQDVTKETFLSDVDPEELWNLIEHDHHSDACLETGEHWCRYEVRGETEPKHRRAYKHETR
jgi:hypothetical protein